MCVKSDYVLCTVLIYENTITGKIVSDFTKCRVHNLAVLVQWCIFPGD
jgi:hypothetical protein